MTRLRILHLQVGLGQGLGACHRARQAVRLQDLVDAGDIRWERGGGHIRPAAPGSAGRSTGKGRRLHLRDRDT